MSEYVLITGASSGLGKCTAIELSQKYNVIINGRDVARLEETKKECSNEVIVWPYDLANVDELENSLVELLSASDVTVTKFVHCAGDMKMIPHKMVSAGAMQKTFSVNVFAPSIIIKILCAKKHNQRKLNSAVLISSNISERGAKTFSVYGSSKAALDGLTRNLAIELAPKVRVNSILPGGMKTKMTEDIFKAKEDSIEGKTLFGIGTPSDIVGAIEFLLSDSASWITGQQLTIDGGRTIDITE